MEEKTLVLIKPDGMQKNISGTVLARFQKAGLRIVACKMIQLNEAILREHYDFLTEKPFFPEILSFMQECPVLALILKGDNAIALTRELLGPTDSTIAPKGTIRGDFGENKMRNIAHASDSIESAAKEIARFFKPEEVFA
ncbi:MAG TPA: nucleoside-diphosphate kinase [Opitutae bacterium]|nr:nucleoside-diphosphate kinase [Opitutae bacterium]